ncbi:MAG TPA: MDR family MFS transporter [Azospirillaceae bacterium]|nr:MDR family MFS transporter [Azospirillaceae bacterium]
MQGGTMDERRDAAPPVNRKMVFAGLMLGLFVAAVSQTIIAPAMPRIVADLGAMQHYSWIAVSALLASTVIVPIVGKLSDLYGRKGFYVAGIMVFIVSSVVAGSAQGLGLFILGRVLEGFGMGTIIPLSQAVIGDLVPPRERGKYQGMMGGMFALASIIGPFLGGTIAEHVGWRWLFFLNVPLGLLVLAFVIPFMRLPFERRPHSIDAAGFVSLTVALTAGLLATVWGGSEYSWDSPVILGLYAVAAIALVVFVRAERRASEPVIPPRLWRSRAVMAAAVANMAIAMTMFGAIYYTPMFVQGALGASVAEAGAVLTPMTLAIVLVSGLSGFLISRTGRYKPIQLAGTVVMGSGVWLLAQLDHGSSYTEVVGSMVVLGLGLGAVMQSYVLVAQNAVDWQDLGVVTSTVLLFRSIGSSVGISILGTTLNHTLAGTLSALPDEVQAALPQGGNLATRAGLALDPVAMAGLPGGAVEALRAAIASALHPVFLAMLPFVLLAFTATALIPVMTLRRTVRGRVEEEVGEAAKG